jgi:transposase
VGFGDEQRQRYRGRNVVDRCFNKLKQWRRLAMRSDKTARNHHSGQCLAATLHRVQAFSNTA